MAVPDKGKKPRLDEEQYSCLSPDPNVSLCIDQLREVQAELDKVVIYTAGSVEWNLIMTEEATDNMEVHDNFSDLSKPIYEKRNELIKSIPDFWLNAVGGLPELSTCCYVDK
ncbi:NAP1-related protein 2-like [Carica papaya]|uniref:NAP1-related protein 2-like n=1 Tax=Carica papaya TaxID=3649 RepID=UPI000B8CE5B8|nr:NAP1-related protein 2-like [Carica papaya]